MTVTEVPKCPRCGYTGSADDDFGVRDASYAIRRRMAELVEDGMTAEEAVDVIFRPYESSPVVEQFRPAVEALASNVERGVHRNTEREVFGGQVLSPEARWKRRQEDLQARLMKATFKYEAPSGKMVTVTWGAATYEDHMARIAMQEKKIGGIRADQDRHTKAANLIRDRGVRCLNDIPDCVEVLGFEPGGESG